MTTATQARALADQWDKNDRIPTRCGIVARDMADTQDELVAALKDMLLWLDDGNRMLSDSCAADVAKARSILAKLDEEAAVRAIGVQP